MKKRCRDCKYFWYLDTYYNECKKLPLAVLPHEPACYFFKERKRLKKGGRR